MQKNILLHPPENFMGSIYEYRLVLAAPEPLWNEVMKIKERFAFKFKASAAVRTKPYITLVKFFSPAMAQDKLVRGLKNSVNSGDPFEVVLEDFGCLPTHTIFIAVRSKNPIRELLNKVKKVRQLMKAPEQDPYFITDPYLIIARKLHPKQYEQGWALLSQTHFKGAFLAAELLLLGRPAGESASAYQQLAIFTLSGLTIPEVYQYVLFDK